MVPASHKNTSFETSSNGFNYAFCLREDDIEFPGAERDFVVLSTVRSLPLEQITGSAENQQWLASHLGFLTDERQMNVALTRAKHGLVIIGEYLF